MISKTLAWAGALALAVVLAIGLNSGGDEPGAGGVPDASGNGADSTETLPGTTTLPAETTTTLPAAPLPAATTTTAPPTTTTTPPATTTTTAPPTTTSTAATGDYRPVPKPAAGPNTVAPGGALTKHLAADIAAAFGFTTDGVQAAIAGVALPPEAGGNPEGWLAPGTYEPADGSTAAAVVQAMVDRRVAQLEARIPRDQWQRVLTAASVIEKETYNQNEKPRVARVLANRLAGGGPLQMDSIILYPVPEDRIFTTGEERAANQPYNSYRFNGLPPTPICSPDAASLDAFLAPPSGDWWFYVTIDLHSGETRFAVTYEEHQANVVLLRRWLRDNPTA